MNNDGKRARELALHVLGSVQAYDQLKKSSLKNTYVYGLTNSKKELSKVEKKTVKVEEQAKQVAEYARDLVEVCSMASPCIQVVQYLVETKLADVNWQDVDGYSCLMRGVELNHFEVVHYLLGLQLCDLSLRTRANKPLEALTRGKDMEVLLGQAEQPAQFSTWALANGEENPLRTDPQSVFRGQPERMYACLRSLTLAELKSVFELELGEEWVGMLRGIEVIGKGRLSIGGVDDDKDGLVVVDKNGLVDEDMLEVGNHVLEVDKDVLLDKKDELMGNNDIVEGKKEEKEKEMTIQYHRG